MPDYSIDAGGGASSSKATKNMYATSTNGSTWTAWQSAAEYYSSVFLGHTISGYNAKRIPLSNYVASKYNLGNSEDLSSAPKGRITKFSCAINIEFNPNIMDTAPPTTTRYCNVVVYLLTTDPRTLNSSQIASKAIATKNLGLRRILWPENGGYNVLHGFQMYNNQYPVTSNVQLSSFQEYLRLTKSGALTSGVDFSGLNLNANSDFYIVCKYSGTSNLYSDAFPPGTISVDILTLDFSISPSLVYTRNNVNINFTNRENDIVDLRFKYNGQQLYQSNVSQNSIAVNCPRNWLPKTTNSIVVDVIADDKRGYDVPIKSFTLQAYSLTITSPTSLMVGDSFVAKVNGKTSGDTITVRFKYNNTLLHQQVMSGDTISVVCQKTWFTTAGVSANNALPVTVTFTDQDGKTLTAPLTVNAPKLSITGDKNQVVTNNRINFTIGNRNIQRGDNTALNYRILYGSQVITNNSSLKSDSVSADCVASWFDRMGVITSQTMNLSAVVTDAYGRSASYAFTLKAGSEMEPVLSQPSTALVQAEKAREPFPTIYIAGYSKSKISIVAQRKTAAEITDASVSYSGTIVKMSLVNKPAQDKYLFEVVTPSPLSGNTAFTITVKDQRGFQKNATVSVTNVYPYTRPSFAVDTLYRCDEDGTEAAGGQYFKFRANANYANNIPGNSITAFKLSVTDGSTHDVYSGEMHQFSSEHGTKKFTFTVSISDKLETTSSNYAMIGGIDIIEAYNRLVDKYKPMNDLLAYIPLEIIGYPALMEAYYNTVDMEMFLTSQLMPNIAMSTTDAAREAEKLRAMTSSPIAVASLASCTEASAESAIVGMAKCFVRSSYQVKIENGAYNKSAGTWTGSLRVTNYGDEEDSAVTQQLTIRLNDDQERYIRQKLNIAMVRESDDVTDTAGLFGLSDADFAEELNKYCLNSLVGFREACQACLDIMIQNGVSRGGSRSGLYDTMYTPYLNKMKLIENEILERQKEIYIVTGRTDAKGNIIIPGMQTVLLSESAAIQEELNFEAFLGDKLWKEFASYRRDDNLENQNYISDGLTNAEMFDNAMTFLEAAEREIYKSAESQHSIESDMHNLLTMDEFQPIVDNFCAGNWIHVGVDGTVYKLRLYSYDIDFDSMALGVVFTDLQRGKDTASDVNDLLGRVKSLSSSYGAIARQAKITAQTKKADEKAGDTGYEIGAVSSSSGSSGGWSDGMSLSGGVISGRVYNEDTEEYEDSQYKISQYGIFATDDGWTNTKIVLGAHTDYNPITGQTKASYGSIAERLDGNMLLTKTTGAFDKDGNVILNADGLKVDADAASNTKSVTIRRKNGEDDFDTLLEVDENGKLKVRGEIHAEGGDAENFAIDNGKFVVDDEGNVTAEDIDITGGSIDLGNGKFTVRDDGTAHAEDIEITGGSIDLGDGKFTANENGEVEAQTLDVIGNAEIGGTLDITGKVSVNSGADITGDTSVTGDTSIDGDISVGGSGDITGDINIGGVLNVTGKVTCDGGVEINGQTDITGECSITSDVSINGVMTVHHPIEEIVETDTYGEKKLYVSAHTVPLICDIGEAVLDNDGECVVVIDPAFVELIGEDGYHVFLQSYGNGTCYVYTRTGSAFTVRGTPNISFAWEIKAARKYAESDINASIENDILTLTGSGAALDGDILKLHDPNVSVNNEILVFTQ